MSNYYVDTAADAGGDGTTTALTGAHCAFKTQAQVIAATFVPGDYVMNKTGCTWREQLIIGESGTLGSPITYTSYGTGADPIITGFNLVSTWANHSGDIWSATLAAEPKIVMFDGVVGTRKANHDACTAAGDWVWESGTLFCYSASDPDAAFVDPGVEAGTSRWVITTNYAQRNYIVLEHIHLTGFDGSPAIHAQYPAGWILNDLTIEKGARTGVHMIAPTDLVIHDCTLTGTRALATAWKGIYCYGTDSSHTGGNISIYNCDVTYWTSYAIHILGYSSAARCENVTIHDCDCSHSTTGIYCSYCETGSIYNVTCDDNLMGPNLSGLEQYGIAFQTVSSFEVHHFECTNGRCGMEIWGWDGTGAFPLSGPSNNNWVHHGTFSGNTEHGFLVYEGCVSGLKLERIDSFNNHFAGIAITENTGTGTGNVIYHCSLCNNNIGNHGYADLFFGSACGGWTFKNMAIYCVTGYAVRASTAALAAAHAHNLYYKASGNVIDDHGTYYTLATGPTWETDGSLWEDPKFVSLTPGSEDLSIQNDSPCIDVAEDVGSDTDIDDLPIV